VKEHVLARRDAVSPISQSRAEKIANRLVERSSAARRRAGCDGQSHPFLKEASATRAHGRRPAQGGHSGGRQEAELNRRGRKRALARIHESTDILLRETVEKQIGNAEKYT
jgi:hypothetical protein